MAYTKQTWGNSASTPLSASRLNKLETQYDESIAEVLAQVGDSTKPIGQALNTTIGAQVPSLVAAAGGPIRRSSVPPMGIAFLTDSIGAFQSNTGQAWHRVMCTLSKGRLMWRGYFGTGGFTLTQIRDTHLPQVLAMSPLPGAVAICGGTNDVGSATFDEATSRAVLLDIIARLETAGIKPVLWTLPPRNDSTTVNTLVQRWNVWIRYIAGARNLPLVDSHSVFVDPATGLAPTAWYGSGDGVHPNRLGHFLLGKALANDARFLEHFPTNGVYLSASKGADPSLIAANARFFDAGVNGNTAPLNWTTVGFPGSATGSQIDDAAVPGNWFRFTKTAGLAGSALIRQEFVAGASTFAVGDTVAFAALMRVNAQEDQSGAIAELLLEFRNESAAISIVNVFSAGAVADGVGYMEAVVPTGCTRIRATMTFGGTPASDSWVQFAQPTFLNLTKLGIV